MMKIKRIDTKINKLKKLNGNQKKDNKKYNKTKQNNIKVN